MNTAEENATFFGCCNTTIIKKNKRSYTLRRIMPTFFLRNPYYFDSCGSLLTSHVG